MYNMARGQYNSRFSTKTHFKSIFLTNMYLQILLFLWSAKFAGHSSSKPNHLKNKKSKRAWEEEHVRDRPKSKLFPNSGVYVISMYSNIQLDLAPQYQPVHLLHNTSCLMNTISLKHLLSSVKFSV